MPHKILKRPQAKRDIEECFVYIATENPDTGSDFLIAVEFSLCWLSEFPEIGAPCGFEKERFRNIRTWPVTNHRTYSIFYRPVEDKIEVIRVLHTARNIEEIFGT